MCIFVPYSLFSLTKKSELVPFLDLSSIVILLGWFSSKIVSNDLCLHSRWPTILQIGILDNFVIQKHKIKWNVIWIKKKSLGGPLPKVHLLTQSTLLLHSNAANEWCIYIHVEQLQSFRSLFNWVTFEYFVTYGW